MLKSAATEKPQNVTLKNFKGRRRLRCSCPVWGYSLTDKRDVGGKTPTSA